MTDTLSPAQMEALAYLTQKRVEFNESVQHGREKQRGKFKDWAWKAINSGNALTRLPITQFKGSRSGVQQGFDRIIRGTFNKDGSVATPGIRPNSDYRVMQHDDGEFILLDLSVGDKAWDEYELWLIDKMGLPAFKTEYTPNGEVNAATLTNELDAATRDSEVATATK